MNKADIFLKAFVPLLSLCIFSCSKDNRTDCFKSTGTIISEQRTVEAFDIIEIRDNINLIIVNGYGNSVTVEAGKHLMHNIKTETSNRQLILQNKNVCNWVRKYDVPVNVYLSLPSVGKIFLWGDGNVTNKDTIAAEALNFHHYGAGDVDLCVSIPYFWTVADNVGDYKIKGYVTKLTIGTYKLGKIDAKNLVSKLTEINCYGQSDNYVRCDSILSATISSTGNLYYSGNAFAKLSKTGAGNFIKR